MFDYFIDCNGEWRRMSDLDIDPSQYTELTDEEMEEIHKELERAKDLKALYPM